MDFGHHFLNADIPTLVDQNKVYAYPDTFMTVGDSVDNIITNKNVKP